MIQAYALKKNNRGWIKKAVAAAGAALGAAGGAAALTASIAIAAGAAAGASVLMATPIGWALAGAAAAVGIGLATYQAWKFFSKRWKQAEFNGHGQKRSTGSRILNTLAFWRKTGPSKREEYAGALYKMANAGSDTVQRQEARKTLLSLGLDFDALGMAADKKNAEKLIAAKLAS
jgi:membrane protein implicated in regulation of membrane protease activity